MFKLALLLLLAGSSQALNCAECVNEMHGLSFMIKQGAPEIMVSLMALLYSSFNLSRRLKAESMLYLSKKLYRTAPKKAKFPPKTLILPRMHEKKTFMNI